MSDHDRSVRDFCGDRPPPDPGRRVRGYSIHLRDIQDCGAHRVTGTEFPRDAEVVAVQVDHWHRIVKIQVHSAEFPRPDHLDYSDLVSVEKIQGREDEPFSVVI